MDGSMVALLPFVRSPIVPLSHPHTTACTWLYSMTPAPSMRVSDAQTQGRNNSQPVEGSTWRGGITGDGSKEGNIGERCIWDVSGMAMVQTVILGPTHSTTSPK